MQRLARNVFNTLHRRNRLSDFARPTAYANHRMQL